MEMSFTWQLSHTTVKTWQLFSAVVGKKTTCKHTQNHAYLKHTYLNFYTVSCTEVKPVYFKYIKSSQITHVYEALHLHIFVPTLFKSNRLPQQTHLHYGGLSWLQHKKRRAHCKGWLLRKVRSCHRLYKERKTEDLSST